MTCRHVRGAVTLEGSDPVVVFPDVLVQLFATDGLRLQLLARTRTNAEGRFTFNLDELPRVSSQLPFLTLRVRKNRRELSLEKRPQWSAEENLGEVILCVVVEESCPGPAEPDSDFEPEVGETLPDPPGNIWGRVMHQDGTAAGGVTVRVWALNPFVSPEDPAAETTATDGGWYRFTTATGGGALPTSFQVKAYAPDDRLLVAADGIYDATPPRRVDLRTCDDAYRKPTEWSRISAALTPNVPSDHLDQVDIRALAILSGMTGWDLKRIHLWVQANRMAVRWNPGAVANTAEAIYGLLRQGFPTNGSSLLARRGLGVHGALLAAWHENLIAHSALAFEDTLVGVLESAWKAELASNPYDSFGAILTVGAGGLTTEQVNEFCDAFAGFTGSDEDFWIYLATLSHFTTTIADEAKRRITLGTLALGWAPAVGAILTRIGSGPASDVSSLTFSDWEGVAADTSPLPGGLEGNLEVDRRASLAQILNDHAEAMFPHLVVRNALLSLSSPTGLLLEAVDWLGAHSSADLRTVRIEEGDNADGARTVQRLYRVATSSDAATSIVTLMNAGVASANQIHRMGRTRFIETFSGSLGEAGALEIFQKARSLSAMTRNFYAQAAPTLSCQGMQFLPDDGTDVSSLLPDYETLFGSLSSCACVECRSIIGPTAYLVDLLQWLDHRVASTGGSALDKLLERRPDLAALALSCENTNRAMPYIDLVLEVLEDIVVSTSPSAHDTTAETPELLASPENTNQDAYDALLGATDTLRTPFHRPLEEARAFLAHLGIHRVALMRALKKGDFSGATVDNDGIGQEALGLSSEMWDALTGTGSEADYWPEGTTDLHQVVELRRRAELSFPDILDLVHSRFVSGQTTRCVAPDHLSVSGSDPANIATYQVLAGGSTPTDSDWARMRAFLRIWRATGWSILDLDKVLWGLNLNSPGTLNVARLGALRRIERLTGLSPVEIASLFDAHTMDTFPDRDTRDAPVSSLYDRVYLNPALVSASDRAEGPFALNADRDELETAATTDLADHLPEIQAALGVDSTELAVLVGQLGDSPKLNLNHLSCLYRYCTLAQVAGLRPSELVALETVSGLEFFGVLDDTITLLEDIRTWKEAGWTVDAISYVLNHESADRVAPTDAFLQRLLGRARSAMAAWYGSLSSASNESGVREALAKVLAEELGVERAVVQEWQGMAFSHAPALASDWNFVLAEDKDVETSGTNQTTVEVLMVPAGQSVHVGAVTVTTVAPILVTLDAAAGVSVSEGTAVTVQRGSTWTLAEGTTYVIPEDTSVLLVDDLNYVPDGDITGVVTGGFSGTDGDGALQVFPPGTGITLATGTITKVPAGTSVVLTHTGSQVVFDPLATDHPFGISLTDPLLRLLRKEFWNVDSGGSDPWFDLVRNPDPIDQDMTDDFTVADLVAKAALVIKTVGMDAEERAWWTAAEDPNLPAPGDWDISTDGPNYVQLRNLVRLFAQRQRLPGTSPTFVSLLNTMQDPGTAEVIAEAIATRTSWDKDLLLTLVTGFLTDGVIQTADGLQAFCDLVEMTRRAGASADTVVRWGVNPSEMDATISASVVTAVRSRYATPEAWAAVARPIRDVLRRRQRDALVTHLLASINNPVFPALPPDPKLLDSEDLYEYLLIDVNMGPEMLTSRVKQAACTVQLFIYRLMLGLERAGGTPLVDLNNDDRQQWEWMRTFRVWQAARKVFLYPENWIEPELRDDKTPFFKQMEQDLGQGDITLDRVEQSALDYLDKLHAVSSLKVLGYYCQKETVDGEALDRLHVVARSFSEPPSYWYRCRDDSATWTPWEKIDCGVQGDLLLPLVYNRRLMLFWATTSIAGTGGDTPVYHLEFHLSYSTYRDGKWAAKCTSQLTIAGLENDVCTDLQDSGYYALVYAVSDSLMISVVRRVPSGFATNADIRYGTWVLDPCRGELSMPQEAQPADKNSESGDAAFEGGVENANWYNPGFLTGIYPPHLSFLGPKQLTVYKGDVDLSGVGDFDMAMPVPLLRVLNNATVVTTRQYGDFMSQAPFFVQWEDRCYFVEYLNPQIYIEASASGVSTFKDGTWTPAFDEEGHLVDEPEPIDAGSLASLASSTAYEGDAAKTYAVESTYEDLSTVDSPNPTIPSRSGYQFSLFYHPYACEFLKVVRRSGILELLDPDPNGTDSGRIFRQQLDDVDFHDTFQPDLNNVTSWQERTVDFGFTGAYSTYNWEIFFHLPFYVALRLSAAHRFGDALTWFHTLFDPRTSHPVPSGKGYADNAIWWKIRPFLDPVAAPVTNWAAFTSSAGTGATSFEKQVAAWQDDPFNPHLIARMRPGSYQKTVVMRYIQNLLDWGDQLFTQDTIESLNEATQLYVLAKQILGARPDLIPATTVPTVATFAELRDQLDAFGNATVVLENAYTVPVSGLGTGHGGTAATDGIGNGTYFCIPINEKLLGLWDLVDDRLYKLRNGMNILGIRRTLPLFEPPIDPAMLVRAAAAGVDIGTATDALSLELPYHRYTVLVGRAQALTSTARNLGQALLGALEKQDAEALALLRVGHELSLLRAITAIKEAQLAEAEANVAAITAQQANIESRRAHYQGLVDGKWIGLEQAAADVSATASLLEAIGAGLQSTAAIASFFPDVMIGTMAALVSGGKVVKDSAHHFAVNTGFLAATARGAAAYLSTAASYKRREEEWKFQVDEAKGELTQIAQQYTASTQRQNAATKELANHQIQISQSEEVQDWMTSKFTNQELYRWMSGQLASTYSQAYQAAVAYAKKAERCYNFELGRSDSFIQPIYWDSTRKGLLAADLLAADIDRMEASYLDHDFREFELTKVISLLRLDPVALFCLQQKGETWIQVPDALFDLDCPGHYFRRIRAVTLTLSCISGPLASVPCELTLSNSSYYSTPGGNLVSDATEQAIVTSSGQEDAGLFQVDLKDPRYLPFEGRGVESTWRLRLTSAVPTFDWSTLADVSLRFRYTARYGGDAARETTRSGIFAALNATTGGLDTGGAPTTTGLVAGLVASRDFADALQDAISGSPFRLSVDITSDLLPYFASAANTITLSSVLVLVEGASSGDTVNLNDIEISGEDPPTLVMDPISGLPSKSFPLSGDLSSPVSLVLTLSTAPASVRDVALLLFYTLN